VVRFPNCRNRPLSICTIIKDHTPQRGNRENNNLYNIYELQTVYNNNIINVIITSKLNVIINILSIIDQSAAIYSRSHHFRKRFYFVQSVHNIIRKYLHVDIII